MTDITPTVLAPYGTFGNACRNLRLKRGWTQEQLGKKLGISQVSVAWWECGRSLPSSTNMAELARCFSVPLEYLRAHKRTLFVR